MSNPVLAVNQVLVMATAFAVASSWPAYSQRACSAGAGAKAVETKAAAAQVQGYAAQPPLAAVVNGGGSALLTDSDGQKFPLQFTIGAVLYSSGSAQGQVSFVFPMLFTLKWGALPGVELMHLVGEITAGSVKPNGDVELTGPFIETDYTRAEGIVFQEDSRVTGVAGIRIVVSGVPGSQQFTLAWCSFIPPGGAGSFSVEVTKGTLSIHR